jgi:UDP-N-acetylglucosamine 2-epimerase (non-hydrolysing)
MKRKNIIHLIIATRPNIMKIAPLYHALKQQSWAEPVLVHTGQHYDDAMSDGLLRNFSLPRPDFHLGISGKSHAQQTGMTMIAYEALCLSDKPDLVIVPGDVNATLACALSAKKLNISLAHLEAGLRSHDRTMPEEINRLAVDAIADWHWTPSPDATENLQRQDITPSRIREVGNIMIDAYHMLSHEIHRKAAFAQYSLNRSAYAVATIHRPANVDHLTQLKHIVNLLGRASERIPLVIPLHPRTRDRLITMGEMDALSDNRRITLIEAQSYITFMSLVSGARLVITDSGGVQEESSYLGIPCLTLRENTERPITVTHGTNRLVSLDTLLPALDRILSSPVPARPVIPKWDGKVSERIIDHIKEILCVPAARYVSRLETAA